MPSAQKSVSPHWTVHLISDLCADDVWSASDVDVFDRDDYLTTLAELRIPGNRYNFAGANQTERFFRYASKAEAKDLEHALRDGRFHCTPLPNMLNCGAYTLATYPLLLEPYRQLCERIGKDRALSHDAYHMESPTWTNGMVNLLACAGFRSFTKTMLHYGAPWVDVMRGLPRLLKLEVAPGRSVFLLLGCGHYQEGNGSVIGVSKFAPHEYASWQAQLEQAIIPTHVRLGKTYPVDAIALIGSYCDLLPVTKTHAPVKVAAIDEVNKHAVGYHVVNSTFATYFNEIEAQLGPPAQANIRAVRGDIGSSWDLWPNAVQALWSKVRQYMRDVSSLLTLDAMAQPDRRRQKLLDTAVHELVALGDHAWNGNVESDMPGVKATNLAIRQRRLGVLSKVIDSAHRNFRHGKTSLRAGQFVNVVNTLSWKRDCQVTLPKGLGLLGSATGKPLQPREGRITIPALGAFESRRFQIAKVQPPSESSGIPLTNLPFKQVRPVLFIGPEEIEPTFDAQSNSWRIGPFRVTLEQHKTTNPDVHELVFDVQGEPPSVGYELCVRFDLPWKRCEWRGESGGGFVTLGPTDKGGDSLLGIAGSIFSAGEGLSAYSKRSNQRIDFAFDESGYCGLGRRTTLFARGMYNDKPDESLMRECLMRSTQTEATLYWYLLSNQQNFREALLDQAGARQWRFRCGVRTAIGKFNDVDLYHFAVGFNREAEVVDATIVPVATDWLTIGSSSVIVLGCQRRRNVTEVDVYNTSPESAHTRLRGELVNNASLTRADMLGFNCRHMQSRSLNLAPLEFAKVIIVDERSS